MIRLTQTYRTDSRLLETMKYHYSQPKGFVGRNICYAIYYNDVYYGHIVAGSATKNLKQRKEFFPEPIGLNNIVNNTYYHIEKREDKYPCRNFTTRILEAWREIVKVDWHLKYGDIVEGFETLIEHPRVGECYRRDGWRFMGFTKGYSCKRTAGIGTDSWTGKRVWETVNLYPKRILLRDA